MKIDWRSPWFSNRSKLKTYQSVESVYFADDLLSAFTVIVCGQQPMEMLQTQIQTTVLIPALLRIHLLCRPMALNPRPVHLPRRTSRTLPRGETKHQSGDAMQINISNIRRLGRKPCGVKVCVKYSCRRKVNVSFTASHLLQRLWLKLALFSFFWREDHKTFRSQLMVWSWLPTYFLDSNENVLRNNDSNFMTEMFQPVNKHCRQKRDMKSDDFTHNVSSSSRCQGCSYHPTHVHLRRIRGGNVIFIHIKSIV